MVVNLVELISRVRAEIMEAQFTEEALRMMSEANNRLEVKMVVDVALGSMDVVVLSRRLNVNGRERLIN